MKIVADWEFNVLGIYNYRRNGKLKIFFDWLQSNHEKVEGDILEAGVFQGKTLLAVALFLKEIGSVKKVFGYDSFSGFPPVYHGNDDLTKFDDLYARGLITEEHLKRHQKLVEMRALLHNEKIAVQNISTSNTFSNANIDLIKKKADYLELDNIVLVDGRFDETMRDSSVMPSGLCAGNLDCDLYNSYELALPFIWSRMASGGFLFLDEYYSLKFPGARIACNDFFAGVGVQPVRALGLDDDFERWYVIKP